MKCVRCGADIPNGSEFCTKCGFGQTGKDNPVRRKDLEEEFRHKAQVIYSEYDFYGDGECSSIVKKFRGVYHQRENKFPKKPMSSPIGLVIACVFIAVFSVLIPGLNFNNPDFQFIASDATFAKGICASIGMLPIVLCVLIAKILDEGVSLGKIVGAIAGAAVLGFIDIVILSFFNGFFQHDLFLFTIITSCAIVAYAVYNVIRYVLQSTAREQYNDLTQLMNKYKRDAEDELDMRLDELCKEYDKDLTKEKMENILLIMKLGTDIDRLHLPQIDDDDDD